MNTGRTLAFIGLLLLSVSNIYAREKQDTLKYRITLRDKAKTTYSLSNPESFLSAKALERRKRQNITVDSTDLPVCKTYTESIRKAGAKILVTGKWENTVTISCNNPKTISKIESYPFVKNVELVWRRGSSKPSKEKKRDEVTNAVQRVDSTRYGTALNQIRLSHADQLHDAGFKGQGMTIGIIDAGYHNADKITAMSNIKVLGIRDFVDSASDIYAANYHGMMVFSCMAMNQPNIMIGTAPEASYWLLRSEDNDSEQLVEQDYWAAAVEFADSVGCDVLNTSLGYYTFDTKDWNYELRQLDGHYALISRQASRVADKGMVLVCSAGNSGSSSWKKITPPADAENVITVGAIDKDGVLATFSSIGTTADGRIKPDVVAVGKDASVMGTNGVQTHKNGTSFASPIMCGMVTCLWQAHPELTAKQVIALVRSLGDRANYPDNVYGYGIPDFSKALPH